MIVVVSIHSYLLFTNTEMITAKVVSLDKQTKRDGGDKGITYFNVMTMDN
jgi:hypothetical protein